MSEKRIRPFDTSDYFPIHNYVFDECMPKLSNAGWRVLCVAIRKTWGWKEKGSSSWLVRVEWDQISYSQFLEASGLKSRGSVSAGIQECLEFGYLVRRSAGKHPGTGQTIYAYSLNRDFEAYAAGTESVPAPSTESVPAGAEDVPGASTESVLTKQHRSNNDVGGDIVQELVEFGFNGARKAVSRYGADRCREVLGHALRQELGPGWIQVTLRSGEPVPAGDDGDSRKKLEVCPRCWTHPCTCDEIEGIESGEEADGGE